MSTPPAPVISDVNAVPSTTGATITWTTDIAADSQVSYGPDTSYGTDSPLDTALLTSHAVTLSGLSGGTTYHYVVKSAADEQSASSDDATFATNTTPAPSEAQYAVQDLVSASRTRWQTSVSLVGTALKGGGKDRYTLQEADDLVAAYKTKKF